MSAWDFRHVSADIQLGERLDRGAGHLFTELYSLGVTPEQR
jgi:hypothetical protein